MCFIVIARSSIHFININLSARPSSHPPVYPFMHSSFTHSYVPILSTHSGVPFLSTHSLIHPLSVIYHHSSTIAHPPSLIHHPSSTHSSLIYFPLPIHPPLHTRIHPSHFSTHTAFKHFEIFVYASIGCTPTHSMNAFLTFSSNSRTTLTCVSL